MRQNPFTGVLLVLLLCIIALLTWSRISAGDDQDGNAPIEPGQETVIPLNKDDPTFAFYSRWAALTYRHVMAAGG